MATAAEERTRPVSHAAASGATAVAIHERTPRIALIGNPNTGKTTLFNRLCGARAKTANFPGTTTAMRIGRMVDTHSRASEVVDLPGIYRLTLDAPESRLCRSVLLGEGL